MALILVVYSCQTSDVNSAERASQISKKWGCDYFTMKDSNLNYCYQCRDSSFLKILRFDEQGRRVETKIHKLYVDTILAKNVYQFCFPHVSTEVCYYDLIVNGVEIWIVDYQPNREEFSYQGSPSFFTNIDTSLAGSSQRVIVYISKPAIFDSALVKLQVRRDDSVVFESPAINDLVEVNSFIVPHYQNSVTRIISLYYRDGEIRYRDSIKSTIAEDFKKIPFRHYFGTPGTICDSFALHAGSKELESSSNSLN